MLTPLDIQNAAFHRAWRGYNEQEVDDFLDRVFLEYEQLYRENLELKEQLEKNGPAVQPALTPASGVFVQPITGGITEDALARSNEIIGEAQRRANELIAQAQQQVAREKVRLEELKQQRRMFKEQFKTMLQTFVHILKTHDDYETTEGTVVLNRDTKVE